MHYVISDIHGEYEKYLKMLELISFSDDDVLYVLGDMADRHPGGVNVIKHVKSLKNAVAILGNHELMMTQVLGIHNSPFAGGLWSQNGGMLQSTSFSLNARKKRDGISLNGRRPFRSLSMSEWAKRTSISFMGGVATTPTSGFGRGRGRSGTASARSRIKR